MNILYRDIILRWINQHIYMLSCADRNLGVTPNRSLFWFRILDTPSSLKFHGLAIVMCPLKKKTHTQITTNSTSLVGGFNPSEKYDRQIGIISPNCGVKIKKSCKKPPTGSPIFSDSSFRLFETFAWRFTFLRRLRFLQKVGWWIFFLLDICKWHYVYDG